jgi:hypothetical protein
MEVWNVRAVVSCLMIVLLAGACATPPKDEVARVAAQRLEALLGRPFVVRHVKSEFNEGNGDPGRVRIWVAVPDDPDLAISFSASWDDGALRFEEEVLQGRFDRVVRTTAHTRTFLEKARPHLNHYRVRAEVRKDGSLDLRLRLFEPACEGPDCTIFERLSAALAAFAYDCATSLSVSVTFQDGGDPLPPAEGEIFHFDMPPGEGHRWRQGRATYHISELAACPPPTAAALRGALAFNRSSNLSHRHHRIMARELEAALTRRAGEAIHLDRGGSPLELSADSLTRLSYTGTACPVAGMGRRIRCPDAVAFQVDCLYDMDSGTVTLSPPRRSEP